MTTLLIMTVGQTDVQLVIGDKRHKLDGNTCGTLHDAIKVRSWSIVNAPNERSRDFARALSVEEKTILGIEGKPKVEPFDGRWMVRCIIETLPEGDVKLCTPKLDAVLDYIVEKPPTSALILETNREGPRDPRLSGTVVEQRLRERGVSQVKRVEFLTGKEQLEDHENDLDAVVRHTVAATLSDAIKAQVAQLTKDDKVFVATTGGLAAANELIIELARLYSVGGPDVIALEVPDRERVQGKDHAVEEKFHPAAGYRARWHALSLIEKGNLLGAWGAVRHLEGVPGQEWTQVIKWLSHFASSLPLPTGCDLAVLSHPRMAVRAALRVELALRAGDIPRAVHGTVAYFETALWDHLSSRVSRHPSERKYKFNSPPPPDLVREQDETKLASLSKSKRKDNDKQPFIPKDVLDGTQWYWIEDNAVGAPKIAEHYLKLDGLTKLAKAVNQDIRNLRNDASHNEPTPDLMNEARTRMQAATLWSNTDTFLSQPLVQDVLKELGEQCPEQLCNNIVSTVRERLLAMS